MCSFIIDQGNKQKKVCSSRFSLKLLNIVRARTVFRDALEKTKRNTPDLTLRASAPNTGPFTLRAQRGFEQFCLPKVNPGKKKSYFPVTFDVVS